MNMKLPATINRIIIFRALQLGDMLCAVPAFRALRKAYPNAKITLAGLPWASSFVARFDAYFDDFIWFPGYPGLPEQQVNPQLFTTFLSKVQQQQFDLALQMQGNGTLINPMVELFAAGTTAGYFKQNDYAPNQNYFLEYPDSGSEVHRHIQLMEFLGLPAQGDYLEFPITKQDEDDYLALDLSLSCKKYVCIHPGSRGSWRQWPVEYFALVADHCAKRGLTVVVTGTSQEADIVAEVIKKMQYPAINLCGKTSMGAMGIIIKNAFALISNCTGVSHMAAALKTPSIVISMDGEPERWAPINTTLHHTVDWLTLPNLDKVLEITTALTSPFGISNTDSQLSNSTLS